MKQFLSELLLMSADAQKQYAWSSIGTLILGIIIGVLLS